MNMSGFWPATANDAAIILSELKKRKFLNRCYSSNNFLANYLLDYLQRFKRDTDGQVILLADRGYRFIANEVESYGIRIVIPAIQQQPLVLGDDDSQVSLV